MVKKYVIFGLEWLNMEFIGLLLPNYVLISFLKFYLDTLKRLWLLCENSFLALFRLFRGPPKKNGWKSRDPTR